MRKNNLTATKRIILGFIIATSLSACSDNSKENAVATDVCNCMNKLDKTLSETTKKIIIKASKTNEPVVTATNEINQLSDPQEQAKVTSEFEGFGNNPEMDQCMGDIEKKYPEAKNPDEKTKQKILEKMDKNCELGAALMRMTMKTKTGEQ
jgi:hypothetical protein